MRTMKKYFKIINYINRSRFNTQQSCYRIKTFQIQIKYCQIIPKPCPLGGNRFFQAKVIAVAVAGIARAIHQRRINRPCEIHSPINSSSVAWFRQSSTVAQKRSGETVADDRLRRRSPAVVSSSRFIPSAAVAAAAATAVAVLSLSLAPTYGQMGVPAYVKAALCSAHPRPAICQCQGASAVSIATPPASRGCECERVRASGAGNPRFRATSIPAGGTQPPGLCFHHHRRCRCRRCLRHPLLRSL